MVITLELFNLGLIEQFHYVASLKKENVTSHNEIEVTDEDEKQIKEDETAFEHTCKVKRAPFETSLIPENQN